MKAHFLLFLKGFGMGAANVIPGVSGGTVALITGIFERLINAIKSFDLQALRLLRARRYRALAEHVSLYFLVAVGCGVALSIISLARALDFMFTNYPVYIWAYFFGLILASVYYVGKTVSAWSPAVVCACLIGAAGAFGITFLSPASPNESFPYLFACGVVAMCSMILPGLSGSFVLLLMGNYELVINAVNTLNIAVLLPMALGAGIGIMAFSRILSWLYRRFRNVTIAFLTGFILGSLGVIWPWKNIRYLQDAAGNAVLRHGEPVIHSYSCALPPAFNSEVILASVLALVGIVTLWAMENAASGKQSPR
jgi:putative membrane protein